GDPIADVITGVVPELNGDYDPDNEADGAIFEDTLTTALIDDVDFGTLVFNADGTFIYTPDAGNTTGADSFTYTVSDEYGGTSNTATVAITLTNADPVANDNSYDNSHNVELTANDTDGTITGTLNGAIEDYDPDNQNPDRLFDDTLAVTPLTDVTTTNGGTVTLNADGSFTYTPTADNKSGSDSFEYTLLDDFGGSDTATVAINLTNQVPEARPDGYATDQDTPLVVTGDPIADVITGVVPAENADTDRDNETEDRLFDDILTATLVDGPDFGTLVFNDDGTFTYTPNAGAAGEDTFSYYVSDGMDKSNTVIVTVNVEGTPPPSNIPPAPLPVLEIPVLSGCPAEMAATAAELAVNSDQLQMMIQSSMASNPNMQPCDACASLLTAAATLKQMENSPHIAALAHIFDTLAPIDAPYTPEVVASVQTALANFREMDSRLAMLTDEEYEQYQQSAMADELVEAFVSYVAVLENDLKLPVGDSVALVMDKYFESIEATGNPNIGAYLIEQMEAARIVIEPIVASVN
ncbi:MAG: hypothetical protein B6I25_08390, partial [Planctomycetales bacterium 4572_13]